MNNIDLATIIPAALAAFGSGWAGQMILAWFKSREENEKNRIINNNDLIKHQDSLTFEILKEARVQMAILTEEVKKLRPMEIHLFHLQQALEHLEAMLNATSDDRAQVERAAKAFLNRIHQTNVLKNTEEISD